MTEVVLIAFQIWFFYGPKTGKAAVLQAGAQEVTTRVALHAGVPARLRFDDREATDCSNGIVLPRRSARP